jgi:glycerol uptake facilitator-like aquaporin
MKQHLPYIVELIGTFFLAFAVGSQDPLSIGLVLMALIYSFGHISGGHFNPIVTLAFWLCNIFPTQKVCGYLCAQAAGALLATATLYGIGGQYFSVVFGESALFLFGLELFFGFLFATLLLTLAMINQFKNNTLNGLIIGLTLTATASLGALINPAIALASIINALFMGDMMTITFNLVAHVGGPTVGAVLASFWFFYINNYDLDGTSHQHEEMVFTKK